MEWDIKFVKGIHPGFLVNTSLKRAKLNIERFAALVEACPQTIKDLTEGKLSIANPLASKIEHALGFEDGFLLALQHHYDEKENRRKQFCHIKPDLSKLKRGLFWDTDIEKIDWYHQRRAVIERVFQRGDDKEKQEIIRLYGKDTVKLVINNYNNSLTTIKFSSYKLYPLAFPTCGVGENDENTSP